MDAHEQLDSIVSRLYSNDPEDQLDVHDLENIIKELVQFLRDNVVFHHHVTPKPKPRRRHT